MEEFYDTNDYKPLRVTNTIVTVAFFGNPNVGKTTLIARLQNRAYQETVVIGPTIGVEFHDLDGALDFHVDSPRYGPSKRRASIRCIDTPGQTRFRDIVNLYYRGVDVAFIVCSVDEGGTFLNTLAIGKERVNDQKQHARRQGRRSPIVVGLLNKLDLLAEQANDPRATEFVQDCNKLQLQSVLVSAKTNTSRTLRRIVDNYVEQFLSQECPLPALEGVWTNRKSDEQLIPIFEHNSATVKIQSTVQHNNVFRYRNGAKCCSKNYYLRYLESPV